MTIYRGVGGVNREIKEQYRCVAGVNRKIREQYRSVGGVNRKVFSSSLVIYDRGAFNVPCTATVDNGSRASVTYEAADISMISIYQGAGAYQACVSTSNAINTTGFSTLKAIVKRTAGIANTASHPIALRLAAGNSYSASVSASFAHYTIDSGEKTISMDISAYQGNYYPQVYCYGANGYIYKFWLE